MTEATETDQEETNPSENSVEGPPSDNSEKVAGGPTAFSTCGCLRGDMVGGTITLTQVKKDCGNSIGDTPLVIPAGAARDVLAILRQFSI